MAAILKWMFVLMLLIAVAGGGAGYWLYSRSDELLRLSILQQLKTASPSLKFDIVRANCDLMGRVCIYGLTCALPDDENDQPSLEIPEIIATLTDFENFDNFVLQKLYIANPRIRLVRHPDFVWNWQQAVFLPGSDPLTLPEIEIAHATVTARFQSANKTDRELNFQNFNVSTHPVDSRRVTIQVATLLKPAGPLTLEIDAAIDGSTWKCKSLAPWRLPVNQGFVQLLCDISPEIDSQVRKASQWMDDAKAIQSTTVSTSVPPAEPMKLQSRVQSISMMSDFGVSCDCDLTFSIQKDQPDISPVFKAQADIAKGEIHNGLLAFPLDEIAGTIYADNRNIIVRDLHASSGTTQVCFNSEIIPSTPINAAMQLRGVEVNDTLKARLPEPLRKLVEKLGLTGVCDVDATVKQEEGKWQPLLDLRLTKGTVTHELFPVTVREVAGNLHLEKNIVEFKATGKYAGQPVQAEGTIINPGLELRADITVKSNNLPLDDESLAACPTSVRRSIESLRLKCRHDVLLRVTRQAGPQSKYEPELNERFYDGSLSFINFQYTVQKLQGFLKWKGDLVEFKNLTGVHDGATLSGNGTFQRLPGPGRLDLAIDATDASFDRSLELALPATLRQVWDGFQPQGNFDVQTKIAWVPGSPCEVKLPNIKVRNGEIVMKCFPWSLQRLNGEFSYNTDPLNEPGKLMIKDFHAHHDDTLLNGRGFGVFPQQKPWRLTFAQLDLENLVPNATFRNALPLSMQRVFDFLNPKGDFSFHGPVEFNELSRGDHSIGASWKLRTVLKGCSINAGQRINDMFGVVQLNGAWDGAKATIDGDLDLDSLSVSPQGPSKPFRITGVRGPISFRDNKFVAGTETAIPPRKSDNPDREKRIRGQLVDGMIFLDTAVIFGDEPRYKAFVELQKGQLETYAQQYLRGHSHLAGVMNCYMNVQGTGSDIERLTGSGKLIIDQAAIYDTPLVAQMFKILQLQTPDKAAFENASVNFTVGNSRFDLNSIELFGDTLSMRGRGYVRFDGAMQMDFRVGMRQWLPNNRLTTVEVSGTVNDPRIRTVPLKELDGAVRTFLEAFDPRKMAPAQGLFAPLTGQNTDVQNR